MDTKDLAFWLGQQPTQAGRLLQLHTPLGPDHLLALRAHGQERLGRLPRYVVDVACADPDFDPERLIGQPVRLALMLDDGSLAYRHGLVQGLDYLGSDGGLHDWQLVFRPWFMLLEYRSDCRIWQNRSLPEILAEVLAHYEQAGDGYRLELRREYPALSYVTQFNESDAHFVQRWCEQEGLFWYVEHDAEGHRLVFTDDADSLQPLAPQLLRFHRQAATEARDGITGWRTGGRLLSGQVSARSVDYRSHGQPREAQTPALSAASAPRALERYGYRGQYGWNAQERGDWLGQVRMEQQESAARRIHGEGGVRQMCAGHWFELSQHPLYDDKGAEARRFLLIEVEFFAQSNLPLAEQRRVPQGSLDPLLAEAWRGHGLAPEARLEAPGFYLNRFEGQTWPLPYRSPQEHFKPEHPGPQTAVVVTPPGHEVFTDELNRICVRFHWDRLSPDGELSTCWLRMLQPSSGPEWGSVHVPRAGEEVLVTFLDNDIDRPLVLGQVYGGHRPAWHSSGLMSGYKSKEIAGSGFNQWVMDDSTGQVRTQIHSSYGCSQLNLGYLIDQQGNRRGALRGSGFELRTDAYGALRAQQGLYLSTWARGNAQGGQLDSGEAQAQLKDSEERLRSLSESARQHNAEALQAGLDSLQQLNSDAELRYGEQTGADTGPSSQQRNGGDTAWAIRSGGRGQAPGYHKPLLIASAPADIATATPQSTHLHSGKHLTLSTGADISLASGQSLLASVAQRISLFAQSAGAKLFAAKGKVELQAQSDDMELTAQKTVRITSTSQRIEIAAQEEILITSGGAYIRLKGGNIEIHAPGAIDVKGAKKVFSGPTRLNPDNPAWPSASVNSKLRLRTGRSNAASYMPWTGMPYQLFAGGALLKQGVMDDSGELEIDHHVTTDRYTLELANGVRFDIPVASQYLGDQENGERANRGLHHHETLHNPDMLESGGDRSLFRQAYDSLFEKDSKE